MKGDAGIEELKTMECPSPSLPTKRSPSTHFTSTLEEVVVVASSALTLS